MARTRLVKVGLTVAMAVSVTVGTLAFLSFPRQQAHADTGLVTRGDAEALFHALFTGCTALLAHPNGLIEGNPCEDNHPRGHITVNTAGVNHYCVDDWHVIETGVVALVDPNDPAFATRAATRAVVAQGVFSFMLDGVPLATQDGPVVQLNPPYSVQQFGAVGFVKENGTILPPSALSVGTHVYFVALTDPPLITGSATTIFAIDPSGMGTCLLS